MSEQETQTPSQVAQMKPYLIAAGVLFVILLIAFFWPASSEPEPIVSEPVAVEIVPEQNAFNDESLNALNRAEAGQRNEPEPDVFEGTPEIQSLEIEAGDATPPPSMEIEPEPLDESDGAVKSALIAVAESPLVAKYLVDEGLLQRFVINVNNIANEEMSPNHSLLTKPDSSFRIYQQADREWIDAASFKRYNSYVDALESMSTDDLLSLLDTYRPIIEQKYAEISLPNSSFDTTLLDAINELLDTPVVPLPIEVYSDSVMYKYRDDKLESLSGPQKQLLRTGPENTRRIKDVLRDLKDALQDR
jgi:hypothetical protein